MKITKIIIENFRSIKDPICFDIQEISNRSCFILLGINESGKSNILDAISLLNDGKKKNYSSDCNTYREGENISVTYKLVIENHKYYTDEFIKFGIDEKLANKIEIVDIEREILIDKQNTKSDSFNIKIKDNPNIFENYIINDGEISARSEENIKYDEDKNIVNLLTKSKLEEYIGDAFFEKFSHNTPKIIFWKSSPEYLINESIDLNLFKDDYDISAPLKNIFKISEIKDIKNCIETIQGSQTKIATLEDQLSDKTTKHINKIWKEHKINIRIRIDNMKLSFLIEDKDNSISKYEVNQRSDGFKHFISILLNLSIENETNVLKNKVILLDEPEVHLHPSGEKYLLEELLRISENNIVFFATHSIYMVDRQHLNRHFSVGKVSGVTKVSQIERDNPYKEEVLYEAVGTSLLEHIRNKVLILEGKTDRDIFELYTRKFKNEIKPVSISTISADGCENIIKYTKFFNTKIVKGFVLVDSDEMGKTEKNKILKEDNYNKNNVFEIDDITEKQDRYTLEDLFDKQFLINAIKEAFNIDMSFDDNLPLMQQIKTKMQTGMVAFRDKEKEALKKIFFKQIYKLKKEQLKNEKYYGFFEKLQTKMK